MNARRVHVLASARDVRGLALAGVAGTVCDDPQASTQALEHLDATTLALLLVSPEVAGWSADALHRLAGDRDGPLILILPEGGPP